MPAGDPPLTLRDLHGIGVERLKRAAPPRALTALRRAGIHTVLDLLQHYPRRYIDLTRRADVAELSPYEEAYVVGEVTRLWNRPIRRGRSLVTMVLRDSTGSVKLKFFNQPWIADKHSLGDTVIACGKMKLFRGRLEMVGPVIDEWGDMTGRLVPIYPQSGKAGLRTWDVARMAARALDLCRPRTIADPVPPAVRRDLRLIGRERALNGIHRPRSQYERAMARRRLAFDELLRVQLELVRRKRRIEADTAGSAQTVDGELVPRFHQGLAFELTAAQRRVIDEIFGDLAKPRRMQRLLQGDVGSGKTVVAVSALLVAAQGGRQGALMAPTAVLAEQHHASISAMTAGLAVPDDRTLTGERPLSVRLLTSQMTAAERRIVAAGLITGRVDVAVGTHALISEGVEFFDLGLVVVDEQHRFGVEQRAGLDDKGLGPTAPDLLVMTATPIPRTAAMTVYGDLDVSTLDELPPGRTPVSTVRARTPSDEALAWREVRRAVESGRQAYVVCPVIESSNVQEARSATDVYERLTAADGELAGLRVGLLHGRVPPAEKELTMGLFRSGSLDALVATTVIEVGVDVPNATVMAVIDAQRFGIAQLHQLRGRVGRGHHASVCYLIGEAPTPEGEARLDAVAATTDGFKLAEVDLELRGEGTIMGKRQKGRSDLRLASLRSDKPLIEDARTVALDLFDEVAHPDEFADTYPGLADEIDFVLGDSDAAEFLLKS